MSTGRQKLGEVIAQQVAHAMRAHTNAATPVQDEAVRRRVVNLLDEWEPHYATLVQPFVQEIIDHPDTPPEARDFLAQLVEPTQAAFLPLLLFALIFIIKPLVEAGATPLLQGIRNLAWKEHPNLPFTPSDAALAVLKNELSHAHGVSEAENNGMKPELFDVLTKISGEPLSIQELLFLWRRGFIDEARLEHGVRQSRIRDEWFDAVKNLRYVPPPAAAAVEFVLKGHMSAADGRTIYGQQGVDPKYFDTHVASSGRPPGIMEELDLLNRGEVSEDHVRQAIRQSDVNNAYIDDVLKLRRYYPPPRTIPTLVRNGAITDAEALKLFKAQGLSDELAAAYLKSAKTEKHHPHKQVAESQVLRAYSERTIDEAKARTMLAELTYDDTAATFLLHLADAERAYQIKRAAITTVHSRYLSHRLTRSQASADLAALHVAQEEINALLPVWDLERNASAARLTEAQVLAAFQRGLLDDTETLSRLETLGYTTGDAHLLMKLAETPPARRVVGARPLTEAQVLRLFKVGEITFDDASARLRALGVSDDDAALLLAEYAPPPPTGP